MIWLHPTALIALLAVAGPIVAHILVRQRAVRVPFPTLRFIQPHRLASVRRRAVEDLALLIVRVAIVAFAAAAVAGPFLVTDARRRQWDARVITAEVVDSDLRGGVVRAVGWLEHQPPGGREILVRSPFALGSLTAADLAGVPAHIGLRFERSGSLPATRTISAAAVVAERRVIEREVTLNRERTSVRDVRSPMSDSIDLEISAPPEQRQAAAALEARIVHERLPAPLPGRAARISFGATSSATDGVRDPWMVASAAQIASERGRDDIDPGLRFAAEGGRLVVSTRLGADDPGAFPLVRSVARSLGADAAKPGDEIAPIPDAELRAWTRAPGPPPAPSPAMIDRDDRRWLWAAALAVMLVESALRRSRQSGKASEDSIRAA